MTGEQQQVMVCRLLDHQELVGVVQTALEESIALLTLAATPTQSQFLVELTTPGSRPVLLQAETAGEAMDGMVPVRLRPFDDEHYGQLLALVCGAPVTVSQPTTRWSQDLSRLGSVPRLDTIQEVDVRSEVADQRISSTPDPLIGKTLAGGKYKIEELLGEGSAGAVYRGRHVALDKRLAIKVLHPRFRADATFSKRFHSEARAASRLDHPNVTRVQDFGEEPDGLLYIVMELLRGTDLRRLLHAGAVSQQRQLEILMSVLSALAAADDQGIVHRDIKPENVVVVASENEDGEIVDVVKVCDFGLATVKPRQTGGTDIRSAASAISWVAGTPEYMSPEQILGEKLDIRSDLYSCGVLLFEMLTGRLPFESNSVLHLLKKQLYEAPPRPRSFDPSIDPRLEALTLRALSKEPENRPATPRDFRNELRAAMQMPRNATTRGPLPPVVVSQPPKPPSSDPPSQDGRVTAEAWADRMRSDAATVIAELTSQPSHQRFAARLRSMIPAIPLLLEQGEVVPLAAIAMLLIRVASQPNAAAIVRDECVRALGALRDERRLPRTAEALLGGSPQERKSARELLQLGAEPAASALVDARQRYIGREMDRTGFVNVMRALGPQALAPLARALARSSERIDGGDAAMLEDLLRSLPDTPNPELLPVAQALAHHGSPDVRRLVLARLPEMVGPHGRAILRVATRDPVESVRVAAIGSLRRIGAVDSAVIGLARDVLLGGVAASLELRAALAAALQDAMPDQRQEAHDVLVEIIRPKSLSLFGVLRQAPADDAVVLETVARALIAMSGQEGIREVQRRAAASKGELKMRLERLLPR